MKELKFLYETTVNKQVEESKMESRLENGEDIEVKRKVKSVKPIKVAILHPDRKLFKTAEIFYSKTLADYLKAGLLPYSLVAKRYANDGGPLSDTDKQKLKSLRDEATLLEKEFFETIADQTEAVQEKKNVLLAKINKLNEEVSTIQNAYSDIYDSTAEVKARGDTIEWWSLFLIYVDEDDTGYKPLFGGELYDNRLEKLDELDGKNDPFYNEIVRRLSYLISFWFAARNVVTKIDFTTMERFYIDKMSDYRVEEEKPVEAPAVITPTIIEPLPKVVEPVVETPPTVKV